MKLMREEVRSRQCLTFLPKILPETCEVLSGRYKLDLPAMLIKQEMASLRTFILTISR